MREHPERTFKWADYGVFNRASLSNYLFGATLAADTKIITGANGRLGLFNDRLELISFLNFQQPERSTIWHNSDGRFQFSDLAQKEKDKTQEKGLPFHIFQEGGISNLCDIERRNPGFTGQPEIGLALSAINAEVETYRDFARLLEQQEQTASVAKQQEVAAEKELLEAEAAARAERDRTEAEVDAAKSELEEIDKAYREAIERHENEREEERKEQAAAQEQEDKRREEITADEKAADEKDWFEKNEAALFKREEECQQEIEGFEKRVAEAEQKVIEAEDKRDQVLEEQASKVQEAQEKVDLARMEAVEKSAAYEASPVEFVDRYGQEALNTIKVEQQPQPEPSVAVLDAESVPSSEQKVSDQYKQQVPAIEQASSETQPDKLVVTPEVENLLQREAIPADTFEPPPSDFRTSTSVEREPELASPSVSTERPQEFTDAAAHETAAEIAADVSQESSKEAEREVEVAAEPKPSEAHHKPAEVASDSFEPNPLDGKPTVAQERQEWAYREVYDQIEAGAEPTREALAAAAASEKEQFDKEQAVLDEAIAETDNDEVKDRLIQRSSLEKADFERESLTQQAVIAEAEGDGIAAERLREWAADADDQYKGFADEWGKRSVFDESYEPLNDAQEAKVMPLRAELSEIQASERRDESSEDDERPNRQEIEGERTKEMTEARSERMRAFEEKVYDTFKDAVAAELGTAFGQTGV